MRTEQPEPTKTYTFYLIDRDDKELCWTGLSLYQAQCLHGWTERHMSYQQVKELGWKENE